MRNIISFFLFILCSLFFISCPKPNTEPSINPCSGKEYATIWDGTVNTDWYKGLRSEFYICTAEELAGFAKLVNNGNRFGVKTIKLGTNIMLNDTANWQNWANEPPKNKWIPIGDSSNSFTGTFDGGNFAISGIYINSTNDYQGLFGFVKNIIGSSKTIKNLNITASYIKGKRFVGGLVGKNEGNIINNSSDAIVAGEYHIGGLVGRNYGGTISNSRSSSTVKGIDGIGGLVGNNESMIGISASNISDSYSTGSVTGEHRVGGLVGMNYESYVGNSYSTSIVEGKGYVGGLIGYDFKGKINKSHFTGTVAADSLVGGFTGDNIYSITINSYSTGTVKGKHRVGGFVGRNLGAVGNSYFVGEVTGDSLVGGLVGNNAGQVSNSYATGTVKGIGKWCVGGFVGANYTIGKIIKSYFTGKVDGAGDYIGGFAGISDGGTIDDSYYSKETNERGIGAGTGKVEGKTMDEMIKKETFVEWDFDNIWDINGTMNSGYPYLRENSPK
jgi:hypothetical protein